MKRFIRIAVLAGGASLLAGSPVYAQDLNALNLLPGLSSTLGSALGIDLDPFHIFSPAPPPPIPPGPIAEGPVPHGHHRHRLARHAIKHRHVHPKAHHKVAHKAAKTG